MPKLKQRTVVVAIESDQHAGSTVAVCPPVIQLDDGGAYQASKLQRWLMQNRDDFWKQVGQTRDAEDAELLTVSNGDITDGDHHATTQILSGNSAAQAAVVNELMKSPLALNPDRMLFVRGTEAHVGKSACNEERIALGLKKDKRPVIMDPENGTASHWHARLTIQGVRLDFAHHGKMGTLPWTRPNQTASLAAAIFYEHSKRDMKAHRLPTAPHLAIRSHFHQFVDTESLHPTRVIQTPAWQMRTAFIHRIDTTGKLPDIGGIIVVIRNGEYDPRPVLYTPAPTPVVEL